MKQFLFLLMIIFSAELMNAQQNTKSLVSLTDLLKIKSVGNISINSKGDKAVFTVTTIEPEEPSTKDYKYSTQLYAINLVTQSAPAQLTFSKLSSIQPAWSYDGNKLAFVRTIDGKPQVFILPMDGGEAWQLTKFANGASSPQWSPDDKKILFSSSFELKNLMKDTLLNPYQSFPLWPLEKAGVKQEEQLRAAIAKPNPDGTIDEVRAYLLTNEADNKVKVFTQLNFQDEANVSTDINLTQFYIVDAAPSSKPSKITQNFYNYNLVDFTPDGKKLLLSTGIDSVRNISRLLSNQIYMADADGSNTSLLLGRDSTAYSNPKISPSGKWLACLVTPFASNTDTLIIVPLGNNHADKIVVRLDRNKNNLRWSTDEKFLYFTAQSNGGTPLYRFNLATKKIEQLTDYSSGITSYGLTKNKVLFSRTELSDPSEIYIADDNLQKIKQLSSFNDWVKNKNLSVPEKKTFSNDKGQTIEYWVMKPANYDAGKKYPLLLEIHGGPTAMWGPGESTMWHEFQYFCSKGYGVVYSNPRGSGGYGESFVKANMADWGTGPASDVLTALDKTVAEGWADTSKLLVTGGSYAGYLVAWIIGHDHRFKAACSQRGVYDLATFFGEGNAWSLVPRYFGGYPWQPQTRELLIEESPITYVQNMTTPYIIFHGDNDRRTGFVQSEMMFRSLKVLGRPVEYIRHPGATHEITRSGDNRQRMDQMLRTYEFFERWIGK